MTREEYLKALKSLIQSLTIDEQEEALQYYSDYFEEANDDQKVIAELGSPEELAKTIVDKCANALAEKEKKSDGKDEKTDENDSESVTGALFYSFNPSDVKNLNLEFGAADVVMISAEEFSVETRGLEKSDLKCKLSSDGNLNISNVRRLNFNFLSHNRGERFVPRILISVPKNFGLYDFNLHVGAGNFRTIDVSLRCQNGSLDVGAGNLIMKDLCGGKINVRCGMGNLELSGSVTGKSNIDCGMGSIKMNLRGAPEDYSFDAKVGLGDFRFNDVKKTGLCQELDNHRKQNHFSVNCGMGSVCINVK